jgi:hypothetical protein
MIRFTKWIQGMAARGWGKGTVFTDAEKLGFVSGHDFSRAVNN